MDKKLTDVFSNLSDEEIVEISDIDLECTIDEFTIKRIQAASLRKAGLKNEVSITENSIKKPIAWKRFAAVAAGFIMVLTILGTTGSAQYMAHLWTSKIGINDGSGEEIILNEEVGLIHIKEDAPKKELDGISIKQAEDIRPDLVNELQDQISAGSYERSDDEVAEKMISRAIVDKMV
jgi:hypothetical protein